MPYKTPQLPLVLPTVEHVPKPRTTPAQLDAYLEQLCSKKGEWAVLSEEEVAGMLRASLRNLKQSLAAIAEESRVRKGSSVGEEQSLLVPAMHVLEQLAASVLAGGQPAGVGKRKVGMREIVDVWPKGMDNVLYSGAHAEVWIREGCEATQGGQYREARARMAGCACVLAAGNHLCVAVRDVMEQMVVRNNVCIVKMNPCNDWQGPQLQTILQPFVDAGFLKVAYGGADVAQKLVHDSRVSEVHMTGSTATYNAIMWSADGKKRLVTKPFHGELGCVTPHIVVPSAVAWTDEELKFHAMNAVAGCVSNSGHNCNATEIIVTDAAWPQRKQFVNAVREYLNNVYQRTPWYPGSKERMHRFRQRFPKAEELGEGVCSRTACTSPYLFASGVPVDEAFTDTETWGPCIQEVPLDVPMLDGGVDVPAFLLKAADFANTTCFGTLSAAFSIHPSTERAHAAAVHSFIDSLKYGCIVKNAPALLGYVVSAIPWGAWNAAGTAEAIGSGNLLEHTMLFDHAEKGVVHSPFMYAPKALWDPSHTNLHHAIPRYCSYLESRGPLNLALLLLSALKSE